MKLVRVFLPGRFEDAYLYRGRLITLTENQTIRAYDLDHIAGYIERQIPYARPWPKLLFTRNDWLSSEQFAEFKANTAVLKTLLALLDFIPQGLILEEGAIPFNEYEVGIAADVVLDICIYNGRLYFGANTGLFHIDANWEGKDVTFGGRAEKRFDARCLSTSARFGAVNASCGEDGLHTFFDEFGWASGSNGTGLHRSAQTAPQSYRTAWFGNNLMNYATQADPYLLQSVRRRIDSPVGQERETSLLTDVGIDTDKLKFVWDMLSRDYGIQRYDVEYTFNSKGVLFISVYDGHLYSVGLTGTQLGEINVKFAKSNQGPPDHILSATSTKHGLVVETERRISLFARNYWHDVVDDEVLGIRTFTQSRRYQNMLAITTENGLWIIGIFDDRA